MADLATKPRNLPALNRLLIAHRLYIEALNGLSDEEMMLLLRVSRSTVCRYRAELNAYEIKPGRYRVDPTQEDIEFADAVYRRMHGLTIDDLATHYLPMVLIALPFVYSLLDAIF